MVRLRRVEGYSVKNPEFDYSENAGADFYVPNFNETFEKDLISVNKDIGINVEVCHEPNKDFIRLAPGKNIVIPAGFYTKFEDDMMFMACNKSGVSNKQHLSYAAHIDDTSFQGNLLMSVYNYGTDWEVITCGKKLLQFVQVPIRHGIKIYEPESISKEDFFEEASKRKDGCLGSTGL